MNPEEVIVLEHKYLAPTYKRAPLVFERGEGVYLYDTEGKPYLDFVAGIAVNALGHADSQMADVLAEQARTLVHTSNLYHTVPHVKLAQQLVENSFADRVFFCNSGTEANEGAMKFARKWAKRNGVDKTEIVAFSSSFHGRTMGSLAVTSNPKYREPFEPLIGGAVFGPFNDVQAATKLIGAKTAAVIVEPVQGEGGIYPASGDFLQALRDLCTQHGAALIFDEVQCGLGRTGTLWAYEYYGVTPDLMTLAKPLGNGLPIGAILMTNEIASAISYGDHGSTFAGSALITTVADHLLRRINTPDMLSHVREMGNYMGEQLNELAEKHKDIVEVRGRGLIWGIEFDQRRPVADVINAGYKEGLITVSAGQNTMRLVPPLIVQTEHIDTLVATLDKILTDS